MKRTKRLPFILIIISVFVIITGYLLPSVVSYFDSQLYFPVLKDTGFDGAISTILLINNDGSVEDLVQRINDIFASTTFRLKLPEIFDSETRLPRFPMKLSASRSFEHGDAIQVTWFFDSTSIENTSIKSSKEQLQVIIYSMNTVLVSDFGFSELHIESIQVPKQHSYFISVADQITRNTLSMLIMGIPAYLILLFGTRQRVHNAWRMATVVCVIAIVCGSLLVSTANPIIAGKVRPSYYTLSQPAWRAIAIERNFSANVLFTSYVDGFSWELYPETTAFQKQTGDLTEDFSPTNEFEVEYDIHNSIGYFRMIGHKENWLSMTNAQWNEFRNQQPHPRKIINWLRETNSLENRFNHFEVSWNIFINYASRQGVQISDIGVPYLIDNYPFSPVSWFNEIILVCVSIMACVILSLIVLKRAVFKS